MHQRISMLYLAVLCLATITASTSSLTVSPTNPHPRTHHPSATTLVKNHQQQRYNPKTNSLQASKVSEDDIRGGASNGGGTATIPNEIFNLVKSIVGAGVFSLPAGIAAFGNNAGALLPSCLLITIMGTISAYTFSLIARICAKTGASSYAQAWDETRGTSSSWMIAASSALNCLALNLAYSMILADTFQGLLGSMLGISTTRNMVLGVLTTTILLPLCLVKNLSSLAPFSIVGLLGSAYTGIAIAVRYFSGAYQLLPTGKFVADLAVKPAFGSIGAKGVFSKKALVLVSMLSTSFIAHFNAPKFYQELKDNTIERFNIVTAASFGISIAFFGWVSSLAFLTFGSNCAAMVLDSYSSKDFLLLASRLAVAISLVFSYPLVYQGGRDGLLDLFRVPSEKRTNGLLNKMTLGLVALITYIASQVTDLTLVISLAGAIFGTSLIFIFPPLMFHKISRKEGDKSQKWENRLCTIIASLGGAIAFEGTKMALKSI